jgi:hypothetical protein
MHVIEAQKTSPRHPLRVGAKALIAASCLLLACLCAACGVTAPAAHPTAPASTTHPMPSVAAAAAPAAASRCTLYSAVTYGIDPNEVADTGGGAQLVTVVDPSKASVTGNLYGLGQESRRLLEPGVVCRAARTALPGSDGPGRPAALLAASAR